MIDKRRRGKTTLSRNLRICRHCVHWTKTLNCTGHDLGKCDLKCGGKVVDSNYDKELDVTIAEISTSGGDLAYSHWTCRKFEVMTSKPEQARVSLALWR